MPEPLGLLEARTHRENAVAAFFHALAELAKAATELVNEMREETRRQDERAAARRG